MESPISVCIITKNEERNIARCLNSVSWAAEKIVVDTGSTDATQEIARQLGARVYTQEWLGWAKVKNIAINHATHDWILSLDADEWLPPEAEPLITQAVHNDTPDSYRLGRRTFFLGRWIKHAGWYPDRQVRLFRKSSTRFQDVPVHEKVEETASTKDLAVDILHESYISLEQFVEKNNAYSTAQATQQQGQSHLLLKLVLKPWYRFLQTYIWKLGFLDGKEGFIAAVLKMWYEFLIIAKIFQMKKSPPPPQ